MQGGHECSAKKGGMGWRLQGSHVCNPTLTRARTHFKESHLTVCHSGPLPTLHAAQAAHSAAATIPKTSHLTLDSSTPFPYITPQHKLPISSCGHDWDIIRKAICSSYFQNAAKFKSVGEYVNCRSVQQRGVEGGVRIPSYEKCAKEKREQL